MSDWLKDILSKFFDYLIFWALVNEYEGGLILRNGKLHKILDPGLHFKCPFIDVLLVANIKADTFEVEPVTITTLDAKNISIGLMIDYEVTDVVKFLLENNESIGNMQHKSRGELSDFLEEKNWMDIKKKTTKNALKNRLSDQYEKLGVKINDLRFTNKVECRVYKVFNK